MTPSLDTGTKLGLALVTLVISVGLMGFSAWFGWGVVLALPLTILWWFELGAEWRQASADHPRKRLAGWLMGLPQALFGLLCTAIGIALLGWVLYNSFGPRDPAYSGGFLTFGLAPTLILFGVGLILAAFRRPPPPPKLHFDEPRLGRLVYRPDVSRCSRFCWPHSALASPGGTRDPRRDDPRRQRSWVAAHRERASRNGPMPDGQVRMANTVITVTQHPSCTGREGAFRESFSWPSEKHSLATARTMIDALPATCRP